MPQDNFDAKLDAILDGSVPFIHTGELSKKMEEGEKLLLLDTRSLKEYRVSHIPNAIFVDYDHFSEDMVEDYDKEIPVVVYCSVGYRSEKIGEKLLELGFKHVLNLYGGIFDWKNNGHVVVDAKGAETDSVHTYNENWSRWLKKGIKVYE